MRLSSAFDGSFYPAESEVLDQMIDGFFAGAVTPPAGKLIGALLPHAGYVYSGKSAGMLVGALRGLALDGIVLMGPSHRVAVDGLRVFRVEGFETPLGPVDSDLELADALSKELGAGDPGPPFAEHSMEVQLPLLRRALPGVPVVEIAFGYPDLGLARKLAAALLQLGEDRRLLVVASSDLSHFHRREQALRLDERFADLLSQGSSEAMAQALAEGGVEACGAGAVLTLMALTESLQGRIDVVNLTDSSEASGDQAQVVGYLSALAVVPEDC